MIQKSSHFVKLLLLFQHQIITGRILPSYAQIPIRFHSNSNASNISNTLDNNTTETLLKLEWNEKGNGKEVISLNFHRVYHIYLTNFLNHMWLVFHFDCEAMFQPKTVNNDENVNESDANLNTNGNEMKSGSNSLSVETNDALTSEPMVNESNLEQYFHVKNIQQTINELLNAARISSSFELSIEQLYEKIVDNCYELCGAMIDSMLYKYKHISYKNLEELHLICSLIVLRLNEIHRGNEEYWISNVANMKYKAQNIKSNENFVTYVFNKKLGMKK